MLKATCTVLALLLLAIQLPELSSAKKARNGIKVKNFRLNSKKNLGRVLSIVSAVDLTLRFTHGRIGVIESSVKHLKRGRMSYICIPVFTASRPNILIISPNREYAFFPLVELRTVIVSFVWLSFSDFREQKHDESLKKNGQESGQYHEDYAESDERR